MVVLNTNQKTLTTRLSLQMLNRIKHFQRKKYRPSQVLYKNSKRQVFFQGLENLKIKFQYFPAAV